MALPYYRENVTANGVMQRQVTVKALLKNYFEFIVSDKIFMLQFLAIGFFICRRHALWRNKRWMRNMKLPLQMKKNSKQITAVLFLFLNHLELVSNHWPLDPKWFATSKRLTYSMNHVWMERQLVCLLMLGELVALFGDVEVVGWLLSSGGARWRRCLLFESCVLQYLVGLLSAPSVSIW